MTTATVSAKKTAAPTAPTMRAKTAAKTWQAYHTVVVAFKLFSDNRGFLYRDSLREVAR